MNDMERCMEQGERAEWSVCQSLIQMNAAVLVRPTTTDQVELADIVCSFPVLEGNPANVGVAFLTPGKRCGDVYHMNIDVKSDKNYPLIEDVVNKEQTCFFIEWESGSSHGATPLSTKRAAVTHLALIRMRDDEGHADGYRPFYLLDVNDLRAFYKKYNGTHYVRSMGAHPHGALIHCKQYAEEYGFLYFQYLHAEQRWDVTLYGKRWPQMLKAQGEGLLMHYLLCRARHLRTRLEAGELRREDLALSPEESARLFFQVSAEEAEEARQAGEEITPEDKQKKYITAAKALDKRGDEFILKKSKWKGR